MSKDIIGSISSNNPLTLKRLTKNNYSDGDEEENNNAFLQIDKEFGFNNKFPSKRRQRLLKYQNSDDEDDNSINEKGKNLNELTDDEDMFADSDDEKTKENGKDDIPKSSSLNTDTEELDNVKLMDMEKFQKELGIENDDHTIPNNNSTQKSRFDDVNYIEEEDVINSDEEHNDRNEDIKFTSFGLKEELKEGIFDENENFIRYETDDEKDQDSWLVGIRKDDIRRAKREQDRINKLKAEQDLQGIQSIENQKVNDLLEYLINCLDVDESSMELLKKLNNQMMKLKKNKKNDKKKTEIVNTACDDELYDIKRKIDDITGTIDKLSKILGEDFSQTTIYELTKEELIRKYKQITGKNFIKNQPITHKSNDKDNNNSSNNNKKRKYTDLQDFVAGQKKQLINDDVNAKQWEFKWIGKEDKVYGPYSTNEIRAWKNTYFQNKVLIKNTYDDDETKFINIKNWEI